MTPGAALPILAELWAPISEDGAGVDQIQLLALKQYLVNNTTADSCAQQLSSTIPQSMIEGTAANDEDDSEDDYEAVYSAVYSVFTLLQYVAITNPQYQAAVHAPTLRKHADLGPETIVWAKLPNFSMQILDRFEYEHSNMALGESPSDHAAEWANVNAWIARLVSTDLFGPKGLDYFMHRASYNFLYVLDVRGHRSFAAAVPAAANLFRFAGPVIWRMCREETTCLGPAIGIFSGQLTKRESEHTEVLFEKPGYSVERWMWWKERWEQLAISDSLGEDKRASARDALDAMRETEDCSHE